MITLSSISRFSRNVVLCTVIGFILFIVLQTDYINEDYRHSSRLDFGGLRFSGADNNATLGVAKKIYVLSLPHRTDRRQEMEKLKEALGLQWTYVDAMHMKNKLVGRLLDAVTTIRATNSGPFIWPAVIPPLNEYIKPWSTEFFSLSAAKIPSSRLSETETPLCATENNTVGPYEPNLPEFLLITPARIACWYSHISVIEKVANDRSLKGDDVVIVLEDDVDMERDIHARLRHVWTYLPKEWDIVYLGHCWSEEKFHPALNADDTTTFNGAATRVHPSNTPACNHAYALTRSGARRILVHLRYPLFAYSRAVDLAIRWLIQSDRIKSFSILPTIVVQRKNTNSDIMPGKGTDWVEHLVDGVLDGLNKDALK